MECGPKLQQDLLTILLKWRTYKYVYTADIEKFYRQIAVQEVDQHLQKIVWREDARDLLKEYQLCTVTYGLKAAPFLALRTIKQLIKDDGGKYPLAVNILNRQLYVDDILGGSNSIEEAKETQHQIMELLQGGGFNVRKWASNSHSLLDHLQEDLINQNMFDFKHADNNKALGISWNPRTDQFSFKHALSAADPRDVTTKRALLSDASKLYDPLGWLAPVTVRAKLMFQQAWTSNIGWDDAVPDHIQLQWEQFKQEMDALRRITLPRCIGNTEEQFELHGFCDASEKAYACAIYCKSQVDGQTVVKLLTAKTKLAPLKKPVTLPRLELCGALLLSTLMKSVIESIAEQRVTVNIHAYTDAMIVLGWLHGCPTRWKSFVANRVGKILENIPASRWKHVASEENAADCATRGLLPSQLQSHSLWWEGPHWLKEDKLPQQPQAIGTPSEERKNRQVLSTQHSCLLADTLLQKFSSMTRAVRVMSWISRFIANARDRNNALRTMHLTPTELEQSRRIFIKTVQHIHFGEDIAQLKLDKKVRSKSKILTLSPVLDQEGILRVGGRLNYSPLSETQKHPIILPSHDKMTERIVEQAHNITLHGGAKLTLAYLRHNYWVLGGQRTVKRILRQCVKCHRFNTSNNYQKMSALPAARVTPSRPFTSTGVDFSGHVEVKSNKGRGIKTTKGYIAIFVCLVTKAVHLELVSDMSTAAFLAAFNRLCSRRGKPKHMFSDNGTNFVGAARSLAKEHQATLHFYNNTEFLNYVAELEIEWHFNAPAWPSAGGLWEAAVRSMKHHLKRVLGDQKLTFEEFSTLLAQIEACLNSRPLVSITDDLEDIECLTPGHFLIGSSLLAPPTQQDTTDRSLGRRWQLIQNMHRDFWRKWSQEYLQTLQSRGKWHFHTKDLEVNDIVVVKEDNAPPSKWLLGRVTETHPGSDGHVRVVTLKTKNGTLKRPITKLSRLPIDKHTESDASKQDTQPAATPLPRNIPTRNKRPGNKGLFTSFATILLFIATCITPSMQQLANVTQLNHEKVIYFDKIADMKIIQDEWKLIVYYNMSSYWTSITNIEKYIGHLRSLSQDEAAYQTIASQYEHELSELKHYNGILITEHRLRRKRGLVNAVGYVANSLFGVLDERFAERYEKDIERLQSNENHIVNLYKQHTSIIEGEYNLLKRNEEVMNKQFIIINNQLQALGDRVYKEHKTAAYITANALAIDVVLTNLRRVQQVLLDVATDVKNGRLDIHILEPSQFQEQLDVISGQLPNDLTLPCINSHMCAREMYKLSRVHVRVTDTYLLFEVRLPLVNTELYDLHNVLPIPFIREDKIKVVIPTSRYLAINLKHDMIIPMTSQDLTSCTQTQKNQLLCNLNLPIYDIKTSTSVCEAQLINNKQLDYCRTIVSSCSDKWTELQGRFGAWMFTCCQERTIRIFCPSGGMTSSTLRDTGIISLAPGCVLKGNHLIIHSHYNFHSEINATEQRTYLPDSGLNDILSGVNITFTPEDHEAQLKLLRDKIDHVKNEQETVNAQTSTYHETHYSVMYSIITLLTLILVVKFSLTLRKHLRRLRGNLSRPVESIVMYAEARTPLSRRPKQQETIPTVSGKIDAATSPTFKRNTE